MKKRLFAIMLALAMLLAAVPALADEGDGGKDQTFENNENRSNNSGQDTTIDSVDSSPDISENGSGETKTVSDDIVKGIEGMVNISTVMSIRELLVKAMKNT